MSNPQNINKKILTNHPLKTNFISNTHNNTKRKCSNQKRFSNIAREKQTIQKNTNRYYQQVDMQGSATIIPHNKNSIRQNQYINQNSNISSNVNIQNTQQYTQNNLINNNYLNGQKININSQYVTTNLKSKSPGQNRGLYIQHLNNKIQHLNTKQYPVILKNNNIQYNKNLQSLTQREKSLKPFLINKKDPLLNKDSNIVRNHKQTKEFNEKEQQKDYTKPNHNKKKAIPYNNNIKQNNTTNEIDDDLLCNQQIDLNLPLQRQECKQVNVSSYQQKCEQLNYHKTQKKYLFDKPTIILEKTKSQHNLLHNKDSAIIGNFNQTLSTINHLNNGPVYYYPNTRLPTKNNIPINYQEELKKFNFYENQINIITQIQKLQTLSQRHKQYSVQPNYIQLKQKNFNWYMRAVLMDWMVHVCYEFSLKRQTYYIAVILADKYLEQTHDLPKSEFQLVGAASMYIAAKLEEFQALSAADFSKSTDNRYSHADIKLMELKICKILNYQINPPTLYMWANRFMAHWDNYIMLTDAKQHPYFHEHSPKYFKKDSQQSYLLFRQMMQMLDCSILDVQTLQFPPKILICSLIYLVIGKNYKQWGVKRIVQQFPRSSHYLLNQDDESCFNNMFHIFLMDSFNINIHELLPAVQYLSTYFTLPLNFDEPSISNKNQNQQQNQMSLQQYESFQTFNAKTIDLVKKRYRGVYL